MEPGQLLFPAALHQLFRSLFVPAPQTVQNGADLPQAAARVEAASDDAAALGVLWLMAKYRVAARWIPN